MAKKKEDKHALNSGNNVKGLTDDQYYFIENEFEQIRTSLGMYISKGNTDGAMHLGKEIINNALDEYNNEFWRGKPKTVQVEYYESNRSLIVSDTGRGIPLDILTNVVMHKHVSTKTIGVSSVRNKKLTGLNGTGMTATAALTDYMAVTSYRGYEYKKIEIHDGILTEHPIMPLVNNKGKAYRKTGLTVEIIPSEKYLGKIDLTTDIVESFIRNMSYIIEKDITIEFIGEKPSGKKGKYEIYNTTYKALGLTAACEYLSSGLEIKPIETKFISDDFDLSMAFSFDKELEEPTITSFANLVITTEGGCHEIATTRAICDYFTKEAKKLDPNSKHEIIYDDVKKNLVLAVNLEHVMPKFEGQHKSKISNDDVIKDGKRGIQSCINELLKDNPALVKKIINHLRTIAKARAEASKIRGISVKRNTSFIDDAKIDKYYPVANRNSSTYKELFLCEGDSAAGAILNSRNSVYQAVYTVSGVTENVHDLSVQELLTKKTFMQLVQILGTGIGKDFNSTKLRFNKIIICTDSDVDGTHIESLILCFFLIFMPELITTGKIFRAMPPLYLINEKDLNRLKYSGRSWLYSKIEYFNMINTMIANNMEIALEIPKKSRKKNDYEILPLNKRQLMEWLSFNTDYRMELNNLGKKSGCNPIIIENVCRAKINTKNGYEFGAEIIRLFPEMQYFASNQSIMGSYNGEQFSLICDEIFDKASETLKDIMRANRTIDIQFRNKSDKNGEIQRCTIGEFLLLTSDLYDISIDDRYKGLGDADARLLFKTVTNPKMRKLIRIDIDDMDKATNVFNLLHGKSKKAREDRKEMIDNIKLSYADIDN